MRELVLLVLAMAACDPQRPTAAASVGGAAGGGAAAAPAAPVGPVSRLGEYYTVSGEAQLEHGHVDASLTAYGKAMLEYEKEKIPPPPVLLCDEGAALRQRVGDQKAGEQAARMLHRCLLAAPPGTAEHMRALKELVELETLGLDPTLLAKDTLADSYLTGAVRPTADMLKLEVARQTPANDRGYEGWAKVLESEPARAAMSKCFEDYATKTHKTRLTITIPVKLRARTGDDDLYVGGTLDQLVGPAADGADVATAQQCVRDALAPLAVEFAKSGSSGSWSGTYVITLSMAS